MIQFFIIPELFVGICWYNSFQQMEALAAESKQEIKALNIISTEI